MNSARIFASRNHIIEWINNLLNIQMTKIQQLGSGVIYCLLLDAAYPERVPISKLKWYANTEVDYIHNFKILQTSFCHLGIQKKIQISKLVKAKYQDNLDFIQWFKWFLQGQISDKEYDAVKRRQNKEVYLNFYEHKILKIPYDNNKCKQKPSSKSKANHKIDKKLKKVYKDNDEYLEIFECKTEESDNETYHNKKQNSVAKQTNKFLKTTANFRGKTPNIFLSQETFGRSGEQERQQNKQNACIQINHSKVVKDQIQNLQCMYTSPKQIKKFYFPERFSQRLKRRVDIINGLRKSEIKKYEQKDLQTSTKSIEKNIKKCLNIFVAQQSDRSSQGQI